MPSIAEEIFDMVGANGDASFAELSNRWPKIFAGGNRELIQEGPTFSNVVIWTGMTEEGVTIIKEVMALGCEYVPTNKLVYLIDGHLLTYPIAKSVRHYKKPHWAPVVIKRKKKA